MDSIDQTILRTIFTWKGMWYTYKVLAIKTQINSPYLNRRVKLLTSRGYLNRVPLYNPIIPNQFKGSGYILTQKASSLSFIKSLRDKKGISIPKGFLLFLTFLFISFTAYSPSVASDLDPPLTYREMLTKRLTFIESQSFSWDLFIEYVRLKGINNRLVVISQAIHETGSFSSNVFKENNNLFGMKEPLIRPTVAKGTNRNHAFYDHWTCSVKDYKLWYNYTNKNGYTDYLTFLNSKNYAEDPYYISLILQIKKSLTDV